MSNIKCSCRSKSQCWSSMEQPAEQAASNQGEEDVVPSVPLHICDIRHDSLVCKFCGSSLRALVEDGAGDGAQSDVMSKHELPKKPRKYKEKPKPGIVKHKAVRKLVRVEMIAKIPGFNRPKARAVVESYPTLTEIINTPLELLALDIDYPLAEALKRVIQ